MHEFLPEQAPFKQTTSNSVDKTGVLGGGGGVGVGLESSVLVKKNLKTAVLALL